MNCEQMGGITDKQTDSKPIVLFQWNLQGTKQSYNYIIILTTLYCEK